MNGVTVVLPPAVLAIPTLLTSKSVRGKQSAEKAIGKESAEKHALELFRFSALIALIALSFPRALFDVLALELDRASSGGLCEG